MSDFHHFSEAYGGRVAILLATHNGAKFLNEQLKSFEDQTYQEWSVWASDDASSDETVGLLETWAARVGGCRARVRMGPCLGFVANFQTLIGDTEIRGDYFAFSDQDDIWMSDKLERAVACLRVVSPDLPAIFCSRTEMIDQDGARIRKLSPIFRRSPSFANALVQSIAGGNTMVFNRAARDLMLKYHHLRPVSHDWWAYQLVTGAGGRVIYDPLPTIYYRQHEGNIIGGNQGLLPRLRRLKLLLEGRFAVWNDVNIACLQQVISSLNCESKNLINEFEAVRSAKLRRRAYYAFANSFYRQTFFGSLSLATAFIFGKI